MNNRFHIAPLCLLAVGSRRAIRSLNILTIAAALTHSSMAAEYSFSVSDVNDDAHALYAQGQNWQNEFVVAGYNSSYSAPYLMGAFRFANIAIPQGTVITSAYLRIQAYLDGTGSSSLAVKAEASDMPNQFNVLPYISDRQQTSASKTWTVPSAWVENQSYTSPDIKNVIQEVVNRSGWTSGNALAIYINNTAASGGFQYIYTAEGAPRWGGTPAELIIGYDGAPPPDGTVSENYIVGATNTPSSVPTYLNSPSMYYNNPGGICWATCSADILAYWDRNPYNGVTYWNLIDHGTAPLLQNSLPTGPGHDEADVASVVYYLADQYYGQGRADEDVMIEEVANTQNGLNFNSTYLGPYSSQADRTTLFNTVMGEIDAGRPIGLGSWGSYFGGAHQVPCIGYKEMSNSVNSTVYIHLNTGGTQSLYANPFASSWGNIDADTVVPGGAPIDDHEGLDDDTDGTTTVLIDPADTYNFRQTHNADTAGDVDWIELNATAGDTITLQTVNHAASADPVLYLFAPDGITELARDDNSGTTANAARLTWVCTSNGTYYVKTQQASPTTYGHATKYDLEIAPETDLGTHGTPGWWLDMHGLTGPRDAAELTDGDGDGLAAWQEWRAATDPGLAQSALTIESIERIPGGRCPVQVATVPGKRYQLNQAATVGGAWTAATYSLTPGGTLTSSPVAATDTKTTFYLPATTPCTFYRVSVVE